MCRLDLKICYKVYELNKKSTLGYAEITRSQVKQENGEENVMTRSHFTFRQRLLEKSKLYENCNVIECDEPYTGKTCGSYRCGSIRKSFGGKIFRCPKCKLVADRDIMPGTFCY
eukprot:Awhi_evm1s8074